VLLYFQREHHSIIINGMNGMLSGLLDGVPFALDDSDMDDYEVLTCVLL